MMAHGAVKPCCCCCCCCCCVVALLAVAVLLAMPPAASASSNRPAATLQRAETATTMYTAKDQLREKQDVTKRAEEDVATTGFGAESEREVPTGPDPIHHHGRGPRRQSP